MPGSAAEDYGADEPGSKKFTAASATHFDGLSEEIQVETGVIIGLGSKEYEMIDVEPTGDANYWQFPDDRPLRKRFGPLYAKENPFPADRHEGQGFLREGEVDLDRVAGDAE